MCVIDLNINSDTPTNDGETTAWKVSKYGNFSDLCFPVFELARSDNVHLMDFFYSSWEVESI